MFICSFKTRSSLKFLTTKLFSRTTNIPFTRRAWSTATSSSIIMIAFEELNDEGSDTVFHAKNTVSKSHHDHYTHRDSRSARLGSRYYKKKIHSIPAAVRSNILSKLIFASCVRYSARSILWYHACSSRRSWLSARLSVAT